MWLASTASDLDSSGRISVFFNQSVEEEYATHEVANGNATLQRRLLDRINGASYSIDACLYYLSVPEITTALLSARNRGVRVRIICEADNYNSEFGRLESGGIPVLTDEAGSNAGDGLMHNKFLIFDFFADSPASDDYVWTGSANITHYGFYENAENAIVIQDQSLAGGYTREFEEMWGGSGDEPSVDVARFGSRKRDNTPHRFQIGNVYVEQYMSPSDGITSRLANLARSAQRGVYFSVFNFTSSTISDAMLEAFNQGVNIAGVFDSDQAVNSGSEYWPMSGQGSGAWNPAADVHLLDAFPSMHHKYMLIDTDNSGSEGTVCTGSFNWTWSAETSHDENILLLHDSRISNLYLQEFMARYHQSGGSDSLALDSDLHSPSAVLALRIEPNPWFGNSNLFVSALDLAEVDVYDMAGRKIFGGLVQPDRHVIDVPSKAFTPGVYLVAARGSWGKLTRRMVYLGSTQK